MGLAFGAPQLLWLLAALPLIVLLHYLRTRRKRQEVAALYLWRRAQQAVVRRRRFSPTWLLALQLAFAAVAAIALARPFLGETELPPRVIVIDASASMAARSAAAADAPARLDAAVTIARRLLTGAGRVALIRAGLEPTLLAPLDADPGQLAAALDELAAGDASADISRALDLAAALLPGAEVNVITDQELMLGQATLHKVGETVINAGISALDIGIGQVYVGIVGSGGRPFEVRVTLSQDGAPLAAGTVLVPVTGAGSLTFPLDDVRGILEARLDPPAGDALALDDVAYAGAESVTVVSDDTYGPLVRALTSVPNADASYSVGARLLSADLRVLRTSEAEGLLPGAHLLFAPPAQQPRFAVVRDWDRAHPLTRFVDLRDLVVGLGPIENAWVEESGWRTLARTADLEPVLRARQVDGAWLVQAAFHPSQSDLVLRSAFPTLIANIVAAVRTTAGVRLGEALPGLEVGRPNDDAQVVLAPGVYRVATATGGVVGEAAVVASLLSASESRLESAPLGAALIQSQVPATTADDEAAANVRVLDAAPTPLVLALLGLALALLLLEWLVFGGLPRRVARARGAGRAAAGG
ncbi:MAG: BatA domain-containing protein [Trueperaceae bacterium]|nr:BatA domain-containing protein [Trueperaceae bacterium]